MGSNGSGDEVRFKLVGQLLSARGLPQPLTSATRGLDRDGDPFINDRALRTRQVIDMSRRSRDASIEPLEIEAAPDSVLVLETAEGFTLIVRADKFRDDLWRMDPGLLQNEQINLDGLNSRDPHRGLGDWLFNRLSIIDLDEDEIIQRAKDKTRQLLGRNMLDWAEAKATRAGTKALMWAIESRLDRGPGLYRWQPGSDAQSLSQVSDEQLAVDAANGPLLIFLHGTGSSTNGSFDALHEDAAADDWSALTRQFDQRIYSLEHRTFSESPIDNALTLARELPSGARINLVTHSRGGLIGDLMVMAAPDEKLLAAYRRQYPRLTDTGAADADAHDTAQLRELADLMATKDIVVDRYVRIAAPARGTRLLSSNADTFLSALLSLIGQLTPLRGSLLYSALKRIVLEIARNRTDPALVPGLEAMLPESPLAAFLARVGRKPETHVAIIAGDIEGGGIFKRLGVLFTDHVFFDALPNDLVVDTDSMYQGVARAADCYVRFEQGHDVNHFRYFTNPGSRRALRRWLTADADVGADFERLSARDVVLDGEDTAPVRAVRDLSKSISGNRPVVVVLPGIMGTHLEIRGRGQAPSQGDRVWFDFFHLAAGGLAQIAWDQKDVRPEALFQRFYGDLVEHLQATHDVVPFPYDWRKPESVEADRLAKTLTDLLTRTELPIRVLAHSMGGLVTRAAIARHPDLWRQLSDRDDSRFIMLGTPNRGSHLMVETLIGKSGTIRNLARLDVSHELQQLLDIIGEFRGALSLLPRPGFQDTGGSPFPDYFQGSVWTELKAKVRDDWFGDGTVAQPSRAALSAGGSIWTDVLKTDIAPDPSDKVHYVFGLADATACGLEVQDDRVRLRRTPQGDGSVTWASGKLDGLPDDHYWYMPAEHGALANTEAYFPALVDLLDTGRTSRLSQQSAVRAGLARSTDAGTAADGALVVTGDAGPAPYPTPEELVYGLYGSRPPPPVRKESDNRLSIGVQCVDLRYLQSPIICGHCINDVIAGAEAQVDRYLVKGELTRRLQLGRYAENVGETVVVLAPPRPRDSSAGAIVVGLGQLGQLNTEALQRTTRAGVLDYLLRWTDRQRSLGERINNPVALTLSSLLLGNNSTTDISIQQSIDMIVLAVCNANAEFVGATGLPVRIGRLEFIDLFIDIGITASYALRELPERLSRDLLATGARVVVDSNVEEGPGVRQRFHAESGFGYWPQLRVTNADQVSSGRVRPSDNRKQADDPLTGIRFAEQLQFELTAARARVVRVHHQRQPGLVERMVAQCMDDPSYRPDFAHTLYQLLMPVDFKPFISQQGRLVLQLDEYTANIPWEMLVVDGEPLINRIHLIRQFISGRRLQRPEPRGESALVIGDPSTKGFHQLIGGTAHDDPQHLPGARDEAKAVVETLLRARFRVEAAVSGEDMLAVLNKLYAYPYRVVHIAAHGVFNLPTKDGDARTGIVLSDGALITAAEIGQLDYAPDFVFLNCCHLAKAGAVSTELNKLAYSVARELIELGIRCVIVAGWAVDDAAAKTFAQAFYDLFVAQGRSFGDAVFSARRQTLRHHGASNTWGAYQAYGDAGFVLRGGSVRHSSANPAGFVSERELHAELRRLIVEADHLAGEGVVEIKALSARAADLLGRGNDEWRSGAKTQYLLGMLYRKLSDDYLPAARIALQNAVAGDTGSHEVPVAAIEQLANAEAIHAELLGTQGQLSEALQLVETAITRLQRLIETTDSRQDNFERKGLLGSAWKRKALLLSLAPKSSKSAVRKALAQAERAYSDAVCAHDDNFGPWCLLNWLALKALLDKPGDVSELITRARECGKKMRARFASKYDFFDAVATGDALLVETLLLRSLPKDEQRVIDTYKKCLVGVPYNRRQIGSVVKQLRLLAKFATQLIVADIGTSLDRIADALDPATESDPTTKAQAPTNGETRKQRTTRKSGSSRTAGKKTARKKATRKRIE